MKSLVIGAGQIGKALHEIFSQSHDCAIRDVEPLALKGVEVLHIAYPYGDTFVHDTEMYINEYQPKLVIIHSSVAVGTTEFFGDNAVHSPERGRFPNLAFEMRQFPKFVGGWEPNTVAKACQYFHLCNWPTVAVANPRLTELCKLMSNAHLGLEIAWRQEVDRFMNAAVPQDLSAAKIYEEWERTYNKGHEWLGQRQLNRPLLRPQPIGGHCILPCIDILSEQFKSMAFEFIRRSNAQRKAEEVVREHELAGQAGAQS